MRRQNMLLVLISSFVLVGLCQCAATSRGGTPQEDADADTKCQWQFDTVNLALNWPRAMCVKEHETACKIPEYVKSWVIHGLWPTKGTSENPTDCIPNWKFDRTKIESLRSQLQAAWPDENMEKNPEKCWTHEWKKHGTCATCLPTMSDEFHYFNATLGLLRLFDLQKFLKPQTKAFQFDDVRNTLSKNIGANPIISCVSEKATKRSYIEQVVVCLNKELSPVDCPSRSAAMPRSVGQLGWRNALKFEPEGLLPFPQGVEEDWTVGDYGVNCRKEVYYTPL